MARSFGAVSSEQRVLVLAIGINMIVAPQPAAGYHARQCCLGLGEEIAPAAPPAKGQCMREVSQGVVTPRPNIGTIRIRPCGVRHVPASPPRCRLSPPDQVRRPDIPPAIAAGSEPAAPHAKHS